MPETARNDRPAMSIVKGSGGVETFVRAHADHLPASVTLIDGFPPHIDQRPILSQSVVSRAARKAARVLRRREWKWETTSAYLKAFRRTGARAVLAEFGQAGVAVMDACRRTGLPLIVHFHGADISKHATLSQYGDDYQVLFREARAIVAVSRAMQQKLVALGAPPEKVHYSPCGVDCALFSSASPATAAPVFLAVGRFVEKKAPQLTILAFARVHQRRPDARLRMIGTARCSTPVAISRAASVSRRPSPSSTVSRTASFRTRCGVPVPSSSIPSWRRRAMPRERPSPFSRPVRAACPWWPRAMPAFRTSSSKERPACSSTNTTSPGWPTR